MGWHRQTPLAGRVSRPCGQWQAKAWRVRWYRVLAAGMFGVVAREYYVDGNTVSCETTYSVVANPIEAEPTDDEWAAVAPEWPVSW